MGEWRRMAGAVSELWEYHCPGPPRPADWVFVYADGRWIVSVTIGAEGTVWQLGADGRCASVDEAKAAAEVAVRKLPALRAEVERG